MVLWKINKNKKKNKKTGFTLVEILAVILIIGLLFVMLVPKLSSIDEASRESGVKTKFREFQNAAKTVLLENAGLSKVMSSETDVESLVVALNKELDDANKFDASKIQGSYCDSVAIDPWNNPYRLHVNGDTITFISYGSNPVTVHAAGFNYEAENCKYVAKVAYSAGKVLVNTQGFKVDIEDANVPTPEEYFTWSGTTITGLSDLCDTTDLVIPEKCTTIGSKAFENCRQLTSVIIPNSVTYISNRAFFGCTGLKSVVIPDSVTSMDDSVFECCTGIESATISNRLTSLPSDAFRKCTRLKSITIPNSVTMIGGLAFEGCSNLTSVTIPNSVTTIIISAFNGCTALEDAIIPNSVTRIQDDAFKKVPHIEYHGTASGGPWGALSMN